MAQTLVESKAVFLERAKRVGLPQEAVDRLVAQTIDTMAKLAFAPCQPGETPTEESLSALIKVGGAAPPLGSIAAVRHLVFEAQTLLVSQTKALVENKENEVKELAPAERRERIRAQANKLRGITMSGQTECSYASYDLCMKLLTDNCISYLSPAKFITREAELRSEKPRKELDVQASTLVVRDRDPDQSCDTSTALSLHHAMHRRSLALDLIGVTDYFRIQGFVDFLLGHLHQEPIAGSRATSVQQILHADRAAWMRLAELTPDGIRRDASGALPLDSLWARLQTDPKVIFHLLPREGGALKRESTELKPEPTDTPTKKQRKGTGKGKTKTLREPSNLPEELKGLSSWTKTGKRRCWGFNMASGCPNAKAASPVEGPLLDAGHSLCGADAFRIDSLFCIEIFSGSGRLTAELRRAGFRDSIGIDHVAPKQMISPVLKLDLLDPEHVKMVLDLIDSPFCLYVHIAPPCGTASRAREIFRRGENLPAPARSDAHPDGLPDLTGELRIRVAKANDLYAVTGKIFAHCIRSGKLVSCENPGRSYFWQTTMWLTAVADLQFEETLFHNCQHGGERAKLTRLAHNVPLLHELSLLCPGESTSHRHLPWSRSSGAFDTAADKVYPRVLCQRLADIIVRAAAERGHPAPASYLAPGAALPLRESQVAAGVQPRSKRVPPLVPEFRQIVVLLSPEPLFPGVRKLEADTPLPPCVSCSPSLPTLPAGTRILRQSVIGVVPAGAQESCSSNSAASSTPVSHPTVAPNAEAEDDGNSAIMEDDQMDPEAFSHYALHLGASASNEAWRDCICHLCELLVSDTPSRGGRGTDEFSWSCGAFFHANKVGLRSNTSSHPSVSKLLCEYVRRVAPGHPFTSLMLGKNLAGKVHTDRNNEPGLPNAVLKISSFEQGGVWIESPSGSVACPDPGHPELLGNVLDFEGRRIIFDPSGRHCQAPWCGGPRITLVAYAIRDHHKLLDDQKRKLEDLGFGLPGSSPECCPTAGPEAATRKSGLGPSSLTKPPPGIPSCSKPEGGRMHKVAVGIPWKPQEFIEQALKAGHPRHLLDGVPSHSKAAIDRLADMSLHEIGAQRTERLRHWISKARELEAEEEELRDSMPQHCKRVLGRKRLVLFRTMLEECGHEDLEIANDIAKGFDLSGAIPRNPAYRPKLSPASLSVSDLRSSAAVMREATLLATKSSGDPELDEALMAATDKEVAKGWLRGPIDPASLGPNAVLSRRFGVWQGGKCRPIDDFKASGVNSTTSAEDSVTVHTADAIAASIAYRLKRDPKCRRHGGLEMKSYDLHKAYKNLPLSTSAVEEAYLSVYNPRSGKAEIYEQCVLPFGARASVHSFCRTSLGIWTIGAIQLALMWSVYYDDFVGNEVPPLTRLFDLCAESLFQILGWDTSPDKPTIFGGVAKVLGLEFDLRESYLGNFYMRNTTTRRDELRESLSSIIEKGVLARKDCERLRGRLQFAANQIAGKKAGIAFKTLSKHLAERSPNIGDNLRAALLFLRDSFLEGPPRALSANVLHLWHVYVDASCDNDRIGLGGVLISDNGTKVGHFSEWASSELRHLVGPESKNPIFECECLAVLMCIHVWRGLLKGCNLVVFSDNEGTRACMIKGASDNSVGMHIVDATHDAIDAVCCIPWFERVNTASNIADDPSRGISDESLGRRFEVDALSIAKSALVPWG
ncbi:ubiad1 [Symbiodinium sp. CCMP2592]|nr:ubiad1 [Symbiodinium sp. CCMP2592]